MLRDSILGNAWVRSGLVLCCCTCTAVTAGAQVLVDWVRPPAWVQTPSALVTVYPGLRIEEGTLVVTGQQGEVGVAAGAELVILEGESAWQSPADNQGGAGNAVQGQIRVRTLNERTLQSEANRLAAAGGTTLMRQGADWQLFLRTGKDLQSALALRTLLNERGQPARLGSPRGAADARGGWLVISGFRSQEAARDAGERLARRIPWIDSYQAQEK